MTIQKNASYEPRNNKNGYEIRADLLSIASSAVQDQYEANYKQWEDSPTTYPKPKVPNIDTILEHAGKLYEFVNQQGPKYKN